MRAVVQRVREARVRVEGKVTGEVGLGLLIFLGVGDGDGPDAAALLAGKIARLRIFRDDNGKMNRSLMDVGGGALVVSQFTLYADTAKGNRPSFAGAAEAGRAEELYGLFCRELAGLGPAVARGVFGADMEVELTNMGPVTIWLDSEVWLAR